MGSDSTIKNDKQIKENVKEVKKKVKKERQVENAEDFLFKRSIPVPDDFVKVQGIDYFQPSAFNMNAKDLVKSMRTTGYQASSLGKACEIINEMRKWRGKHISELSDEEKTKGKFDEKGYQRTTIFLGYTSNLISSGLRETIRYLVQNKFVDILVTTAGGIEEDLIKCLGSTYLGDFSLPGKQLRKDGMNRIGNLIIPNDNYVEFENWINPILDRMLIEQEEAAAKDPKFLEYGTKSFWTPSKMIARFGKEINDESSVLYWAYKNKIPILCPAITDGSIGDMLFFHTFKKSPKQIRLDIVHDVRIIDTAAIEANHAGMIILGGGLIKHHIANACLMRNGADYAVYINTGQEFDGSDAGARPDEAISWGKIKADALHTKVYVEATVAFPLIVAATFASKKPKAIRGSSRL
ncbi:deoxyhypusine synthase family protein [Ascoidea rubescens DSM 1968]|uniref:Deoxyhypusine synthase n=1 Tax=Ascoidea rubescens DSM 1968 TaxID=1344418 RepID=A0A1D2VFJ9_9ASCO|nr:Deoxyhypusine synthase [Ascoidea rubescens DSM 1968]ODV60405.1 Deoxyhypusine synthase [Ascoidea rubescens DSM 1968]